MNQPTVFLEGKLERWRSAGVVRLYGHFPLDEPDRGFVRSVRLTVVLAEGPADLINIETGAEAGEQLHPGRLG